MLLLLRYSAKRQWMEVGAAIKIAAVSCGSGVSREADEMASCLFDCDLEMLVQMDRGKYLEPLEC